jgi:ABC-type glycerol-3-phosphate transport system substrate-binding protein
MHRGPRQPGAWRAAWRSTWLNRLGLWMGLVLGSGLLAASTAQGQEPVSIEIGNLATMDFAKEWLDYEIVAFMKAYPNIRVNVLPYSEPDRELCPLHQNPFLPRNIIGLDSWAGAEAVYMAEKGEIVPIDAFLPDPGFDKGAFYDSYWDAVTYGGKIWGVPWQVWADVLVCDMDIFKEVGIAEPPKTINEMMEMIPKLSNLEGPVERYGLRVSQRTDSLMNLLTTLVLQQGGQILRDNKIVGSDPALRESLQLLVRLLVETPSVNAQPGNIIKFEFPDRHFGMQLVQTRHIAAILGQKKYRIIPVPTLTNDQFVCSRRLYFSVRKATPAEEKASWELIKWLVRKDVSVPRTPLGYPCRKDIVDRPEFKALAQNGPQGLEVLFTTTEIAHDLGPFVLNRGQALYAWGEGLLTLFAGERDYEGVMADAAAAGNKILFPLPNYKASGKKSPALYE